MKKKTQITSTSAFFVGMELPQKLSRVARRELATAMAPPHALALAAKASAIAKKSAGQQSAVTA